MVTQGRVLAYNARLCRGSPPMDKSLHLLIDALNLCGGQRLWFADEHVDPDALALVRADAGLSVATHRCDVAARCKTAGLAVTLSDFVVPNAGASDAEAAAFDGIFLRVAKEKALVHHLINTALEALPPGGTLWLAGEKNEGIRTYLDKAAARAGTAPVLERNGSALLGAVRRGATLGEPLPDQDYANMRRVAFSADFAAWSKPGIFGWQKIDAGSAFLIEHLGAAFRQPPRRVLDLGCGYGYLSLLAAQRWPEAEVVATDNNVAAVAACQRNFAERAINGTAVISDCADDGIEGRFGAVLCNPPFHQGFEVEGDLTLHFLRSARRRFARNGRALFVVNQFIPLERKAEPLFARVEVIARNPSFKLVLLEA